jgi:hypothetical protein
MTSPGSTVPFWFVSCHSRVGLVAAVPAWNPSPPTNETPPATPRSGAGCVSAPKRAMMSFCAVGSKPIALGSLSGTGVPLNAPTEYRKKPIAPPTVAPKSASPGKKAREPVVRSRNKRVRFGS